MAILNEYNELIRENFDISDTKTRKTIIALEDAEQTQLLAALSSALYDKIVKKVDKIDFGSIPRSRGDITKVDGFENTMECLNIIRRLVIEYKGNTDIVDNVLTAVDNIRKRKGMFMKAYALNIEFPMVFYNLIVMAIEQSVSFLISTCIQYIKDPASQTMALALDKVSYNNSRDNMLYEQLIDFNKSAMGKEFDDVIENIIKNGKLNEGIEYNNSTCCPKCGNCNCTCEPDPTDGENYPVGKMPEVDEPIPIHGSTDYDNNGPIAEFGVGTAVGIGAVAIAAAPAVISIGLKGLRFLIKALIPIVRNTVYFFINSRVKLSESLEIQAQLIEANAYNLQYSTNSNLDDEKKKKVVNRQLKIAEKLKYWGNKISIDNKKAKKQASDMVADDTKQKTIDDIKDQLPPDILDKSNDLF